MSDEAEKIKDGLLQELFALRRTLEQSSSREDERSLQISQAAVQTIENIHLSLDRLSERLSPLHIEHSLPLAIEWVVRLRQAHHPQLRIETKPPIAWECCSVEHSLIVVKVLDELLRITSSEILEETPIWLELSHQKKSNELILQISFTERATLVSYTKLKELHYLSRTFSVLSAGQCFWKKKKLAVTWYFRWPAARI